MIQRVVTADYKVNGINVICIEEEVILFFEAQTKRPLAAVTFLRDLYK